MSRPITISIPKPCHENWQEMTATQRGAFCKSCQKEVIDFTKKTEDETHSILSAGGATCGRFRTDQLERPIHQTTYIKSWHWKAIAASVLSFLGYKEIMANPGAKADIADIATAKRDTTHILGDTIYLPNIKPIANPKNLSGKVVSNTGNKLGDATVELIDSNNVIIQTTSTNWDGTFSFALEENENMHSGYIKAYSTTYKYSTIKISFQETINDIVITLNQMVISKEIELEEISKVEEHIRDTVSISIGALEVVNINRFNSNSKPKVSTKDLEKMNPITIKKKHHFFRRIFHKYN